MSKTNMNPTPSEELEELSRARMNFEKVRNNPKEQSKIPLWINDNTTIFVTSDKANKEYREMYLERLASHREGYLK